MTSKKTLTVELVCLEGNAYEIGVTQGTNQKLDIKLNQQLHVNVDKAQEQLAMFAPRLLEELTGLAAGMNIDLEEAVRFYSGYNTTLPEMGCTSYSDNSFYIRNYDFSDDVYDARFVCMKHDNGYASIGFSQQVIGRLDGMNEKGLVIGLHFVNETFYQGGFLATMICRMVLDQCTTAQEASALIQKVPHRYCFNYSIMDKTGEQIIVEASPDDQVVRRVYPLVCTNHFESLPLLNKNRQSIEGSLIRKQALSVLQAEKLSPMAVYRFFNNADSPLFFTNYKEYFGTLHTVLYCPQNLTATIGIGADCEPYSLSLADWMKGDATMPSVMTGTITM